MMIQMGVDSPEILSIRDGTHGFGFELATDLKINEIPLFNFGSECAQRLVLIIYTNIIPSVLKNSSGGYVVSVPQICS